MDLSRLTTGQQVALLDSYLQGRKNGTNTPAEEARIAELEAIIEIPVTVEIKDGKKVRVSEHYVTNYSRTKVRQNPASFEGFGEYRNTWATIRENSLGEYASLTYLKCDGNKTGRLYLL